MAARVSASLAGRTARFGASIRWVRPAGLHVTLAFVGEVPNEGAAALVDLGAEPFSQPPFGLSLSEAGVFPPSGAPRVIWMGPGRGRDEVKRVAQLLWHRLDGAGYGPGPSRFEPHVTLGRVRRARAGVAHPLRAVVSGSRPPEIRWTVDRVSLYESRLGSGGSTYHRLATAALHGGAA